jgi:opacity protein-like surface antigen
MKRLTLLCALLVAGGCVTPKKMQAGDFAGGVYAGGVAFDGEDLDQNMALGGASLSFFPVDMLEVQGAIEASGFMGENQESAAGASDFTSTIVAAKVLLLYNFATGGGFVPFFGGGVGASRVTFDQAKGIDDNSIDATWLLAAGGKFFVTDSVAVVAQASGGILVQDEAMGDNVEFLAATVGLSVFF